MDMCLQNYTLEIFYAAWDKAITTISTAAFILQVLGLKLANYGGVTQDPTNTILLSGKKTEVPPWFSTMSQWFSLHFDLFLFQWLWNICYFL